MNQIDCSRFVGRLFILLLGVAATLLGAQAAPAASSATASQKPRVIVTTDGEIDDECSMVRFLLYANEWDIEGIITSSSQYHWEGSRLWAGNEWVQPYLDAYAKDYPNLVKHDTRYPTPEFLRARTLLGNVKREGEMEEETPGSQLIVKVLLDTTDDRPIWVQAWGGPNTIARALKTIQEKHPEAMARVAEKIRFYFIWEQDSTYQDYILPNWGTYNITTIISDQFEAIAYRWNKIQPLENHRYFLGPWMKENIMENHGALCSLYKAHQEGDKARNEGDPPFKQGDFRSEGDSPAFLHTIPTGLRSMESPDWGGWGGRHVLVRGNTWLDPKPFPEYEYPEGRYYTRSVWGRASLNKGTTYTDKMHSDFFKPMWRWSVAQQNDWAARADWAVKSYEDANHPPVVVLAHAADLTLPPGATVALSARGTSDPDGDRLTYRWWQYEEADTYEGTVAISHADQVGASFTVPADARPGQTIHVICEVTDGGTPPLTRYARVVVTVAGPAAMPDKAGKRGAASR